MDGESHLLRQTTPSLLSKTQLSVSVPVILLMAVTFLKIQMLNLVRVRADITDSIASQKIEDGTWPKKWSPYATASSLSDGWAKEIDVRSLTLVINPAWGDAVWEIAASGEGKISIRTLEPFVLISSQSGDTLTGENNNQDNLFRKELDLETKVEEYQDYTFAVFQ
jgi:hypothetical protein